MEKDMWNSKKRAARNYAKHVKIKKRYWKASAKGYEGN